MNTVIYKLVTRDLKRIFNFRTLGIWLAMAAMTIYFFFFSSGRRELIENQRVEFMAVFLPLIIFGAWAVMAVYFDLVSADREHNVLDCILCAGISKSQIFFRKIITTALFSLFMSFIYLAPVTSIITVMSNIEISSAIAKYFLPLWGYIMVFASLGVMISILARSSKSAMIWSLASGLVLMPRFFVMIPEGIGKALGLSSEVVNYISMISPGILMEALANPENTSSWTIAAIGFTITIVLLLSISYFIFTRQDEYNYGG